MPKTTKFDPEVNLSWVATFCVGFSGADLKALLSNAQMEAYDDFRRDEANIAADGVTSSLLLSSSSKTVDSVLLIGPKHMDKALIQTKASVTEKEAGLYERVYAEFLTGRRMNNGVGNEESRDGYKTIFDRKAGQRQTLA